MIKRKLRKPGKVRNAAAAALAHGVNAPRTIQDKRRKKLETEQNKELKQCKMT